MANSAGRMVFLGFGKFVRADKIYALEPLRGNERGGGQRTRGWIEGVSEPIIAARTERSTVAEMGHQDAGRAHTGDDAVATAERTGEEAERGRRGLGDLGRRARKLLESTSKPGDDTQLF